MSSKLTRVASAVSVERPDAVSWATSARWSATRTAPSRTCRLTISSSVSADVMKRSIAPVPDQVSAFDGTMVAEEMTLAGR